MLWEQDPEITIVELDDYELPDWLYMGCNFWY
jgi:hypothetical protein